MCADPYDSREDLRSDPIRSGSVDHRFEPALVLCVILGIRAKGVD